MVDPRTRLGIEVEPRVTGPYSIRTAKRDGSGDDGGTLDQAIIAHTEDGREVVIGEVWAAGIDPAGWKVRIDAAAVAQGIIDTLNGSIAPTPANK